MRRRSVTQSGSSLCLLPSRAATCDVLLRIRIARRSNSFACLGLGLSAAWSTSVCARWNPRVIAAGSDTPAHCDVCSPAPRKTQRTESKPVAPGFAHREPSSQMSTVHGLPSSQSGGTQPGGDGSVVVVDVLAVLVVVDGRVVVVR